MSTIQNIEAFAVAAVESGADATTAKRSLQNEVNLSLGDIQLAIARGDDIDDTMLEKLKTIHDSFSAVGAGLSDVKEKRYNNKSQRVTVRNILSSAIRNWCKAKSGAAGKIDYSLSAGFSIVEVKKEQELTIEEKEAIVFTESLTALSSVSLTDAQIEQIEKVLNAAIEAREKAAQAAKVAAQARIDELRKELEQAEALAA